MNNLKSYTYAVRYFSTPNTILCKLFNVLSIVRIELVTVNDSYLQQFILKSLVIQVPDDIEVEPYEDVTEVRRDGP